MEKNLRVSLLLDYYGELLGDKQRRLMDAYYNGDLSLSEISENEGITRQGVSDSLRRAEAFLNECEEKLCLIRKNEQNAALIESIIALAENIGGENAAAAEKIVSTVKKISI